MKKKSIYILLVLVLWVPILIIAQTCSCAGDSLFNPENFSGSQISRWHLELSYKHHVINDLVAGRNKVPNDVNRSRTSSLLQLESRFRISKHFSVMGIFNYIKHRREIGTSQRSLVSAAAPGDSFLAVQYQPFSKAKKS